MIQFKHFSNYRLTRPVMPFVAAMALTIAASAQHVRLDSTFNGTGKVVLNNTIESLPQISFKHALQADGKIVICGDRPTGAFVSDIIVARLKVNGTLDSTFGTNGIKSFVANSGGLNMAVGLAIQSDGKIVTGGMTNDGTNASQLFIARLNSNGALDPSFGSAGIGIFDVNEENERVTDLRIQPNGKILLSGIASTSSASDSSFIVRVTRNGFLDNTFSAGGILRYQRSGRQTNLYSMDVHSNGKIVAGGSYSSTNNSQDFLLIRLDSNGVLDNTFGTAGVFTSDYFSDYDEIHSLKVLANQSVVAAGYSYNGTNDGVAVLKLTSGGVLDNTFGTGGRKYIGDNTAPMRGYSMQLQADGKVVVGGYKTATNGLNNFLLLRLTAVGFADTSFSPGTGYITTDFFNEEERVHSISIQTDGKIVAYGTTVRNVTTQEQQPALARYVATVSTPIPSAVPYTVQPDDIRIYPIPVTGNTIHITSTNTPNLDALLYNNMGVLIQNASITAVGGSLELSPALADGTYFLVLRNRKDHTVSRHTVVLRRN